jgi:TolB protein
MKSALKIFLFYFYFLAAEELEVRLPTKKQLQPIYIGRAIENEWTSLFIYDLAHDGFHSLAPVRAEWEEQLHQSEVDFGFWQRERIEACFLLEPSGEQFAVTMIHAKRGLVKRFTCEKTRRAIHQLADAIQKELTGVQGVASSRILFTERVKNPDSLEWFSTIWISDWDGANAHRLTTTKGYCLSPGFLPSGGYYYASSERGQSKIYRCPTLDARPEVWITLRGNQMLPSVDRMGAQIAYISDLAGRPDLFLQSIDRDTLGRPRQIFSYPSATQASPTFSPDGQKLAFVSDKDGSAKIYLLEIPPAGSRIVPQPILLTRKNRENSAPTWSPDGTKIAYSARTDGFRQIWIYECATAQEWQLTFGEENKENPAWAADSLHLIYNTETNDRSELYVIDLYNQEPVQITSGFGQKRFAAWSTKN